MNFFQFLARIFRVELCFVYSKINTVWKYTKFTVQMNLFSCLLNNVHRKQNSFEQILILRNKSSQLLMVYFKISFAEVTLAY